MKDQQWDLSQTWPVGWKWFRVTNAPKKLKKALLQNLGRKKHHIFTTFFATSALNTAYFWNKTSHRQTKMLMSIYNVCVYSKSWPTFHDLWSRNGRDPFDHYDPLFGGHCIATVVVATCLVSVNFVTSYAPIFAKRQKHATRKSSLEVAPTNLTTHFTYAADSRMARVFGGVCLFVCLFIHTISQISANRYIKYHQTWQRVNMSPGNPFILRSKGARVTWYKILPAWVMASALGSVGFFDYDLTLHVT